MVISKVQAKEWYPLEMAVSSAWEYHGGPVWAGITSSTYDSMRSVAGCLTPSGRLPSVFRCLEARNDSRDGALRISLAVALVVSAISSVVVSRVVGRVPFQLWSKLEPLLSQGQTLRCSAWVQEKLKALGPIGTGQEDLESVLP